MNATCPRCSKGLNSALGALFCKDRVHCLWSDLEHRHLEILRDAFDLVEVA